MKEDRLEDRLVEINARLFAMEGRMTTFEQVDKFKAATGDKLLETIIKNQEAADKRLRTAEIRIAMALGVVLTVKFLIEMIHK